jgi:hypothetical protein
MVELAIVVFVGLYDILKLLHNHNYLPAQAVSFSKKKRFTVEM